MAYQTGSNILVALKKETTFATAPATVTGAVRLRITDSPGLELKRATVQSNEKRSDGLTSMARLGYKSVDGSYNCELSTGGGIDLLLEGIMRNAWSTALAIAGASVTTITITTNEAVCASATGWLSLGIRTGDIFYLTNYDVSSSNGVNLLATAVTTQTITFTPAISTAGTADASCTLTRLKKAVNGTTPTSYSYAVEQYDQDIDLTELFLGCKVVGVRLSFRPGEMAQATFTLMGADRTALATGTSPFYTSPTLTTTLGLVADDSSIRYNGAAVTTFTGFELNFEITARGEPVIGSLVTPGIFDNDMRVTGTLTGLRSDFSKLTLFDAETEFEVSIVLEEPSGTPPECLALFLPRVKITGLSAPVGGGDGAKIETLQLVAAPKATTTGYDPTVAVISSSAA